MADTTLNVNEPVAHSDLGCMLFAWSATSKKFEYLVPVRAIPATKGAPGTIEVTEMDSPIKQYVADRPDMPLFEFDYNYTASKYAAVKGKCGTDTEFLITYGDKSGVKFKGTGFTWRDAVSTGGEIKGKLSIVVHSTDDIDDCSTLINVASIPADRIHPFTATAS